MWKILLWNIPWSAASNCEHKLYISSTRCFASHLFYIINVGRWTKVLRRHISIISILFYQTLSDVFCSQNSDSLIIHLVRNSEHSSFITRHSLTQIDGPLCTTTDNIIMKLQSHEICVCGLDGWKCEMVSLRSRCVVLFEWLLLLIFHVRSSLSDRINVFENFDV